MPDKLVTLYRARLAGETGFVRKDWGGRLSVALVYPNIYRLGMANLGFQIVYDRLNARPDVVAERVFLPDDQELSLLLERGKGLLSMESLSPLHRFDLIAFSLSFENDYPHVLMILQLGKIPLSSRDRRGREPFVTAGGVATFLNPEPLARFFDFFVMGEAEIVLDDFIDTFCDVKRQNRGRQEALVHLARHVESLYVPSLYGIRYNGDGTIHSRVPHVDRIPDAIRVRRDNLFRSGVASSLIRTPASEFGDRVLVELGRGCSRSCRFCAAGYVYRPPRFNDEKAVKDRIEAVLKGHKRVGLVSAAVSDAPGIENIADLIIKKGGEFSVSSLRADSLTEALVGHLKKAGQRTLAIAPEAGSERLRKVINKHLSQDDITRSVSMISSMGGFSLRLYFLIGLPTETRQDIADIPRLIRRIKHRMVKASRKRGTIGQLRLSVNCFVPKPFTPFQWVPLESPTTLKEKQKWLRRALSKEGGVKVNFDIPKWAYVQALLSLGDRRAGAILFLTHQYRGNWRKAFRHSEINPDFFVQRPKALEEVLPWDFIDHGIQKTHLAREYELALEGKESEICRVGDCKRCGVC